MKFSVIIPTYNRASLLKQTIDSVLQQLYTDFELIVIDDGSTDDTKTLLKNYGNLIVPVFKENSGAEKSRNAGAEIARGKYLVFLDNDALFSPWTLKVYNELTMLRNNPPFLIGQPLHFTDTLNSEFIPDKVNRIKFAEYRDYFSKDRAVYSSSSMLVVRKDIFYKVGQFRHYYKNKEFFLDDIDFLLRAGTINPIIIIYEPMQFAYRWHKDNSVKNLKRVLRSLGYLTAEEKQNIFAGGKERKIERYAIIGGSAYYWIMKSLRNGIIVDALKLLYKTFPMITIAILKKLKYLFMSKKEMIHIELK